MDYSKFKFRRQFLISEVPCASLEWNYCILDKFHIYVHPDLEFTIIKHEGERKGAILLGDMIDPFQPEQSNFDLLQNLIKHSKSIDQAHSFLHSMGGRFVLVINLNDDTFVFHDPCGLRSVYYLQRNGINYLASQPKIFEHLFPLKTGNDYQTYHHSKFKNHPEPWLPSGYSLYEDVYHLVPNHYLQLSNLKQVRYWPVEKLGTNGLDDIAMEAAVLLKQLMHAGNARFDLALPLTSGWDSRLLLAACRDITRDIYFYTLLHDKTKISWSDIRIPKKLLHALGYDHHLINCLNEVDQEFSKAYKSSYMAHRCWEKMASGMISAYPEGKVCVKGNCSEICRCFFRNIDQYPESISTENLLQTRKGWKDLPFVYDQLAEWHKQSTDIAKDMGIDILDLFYWEHRMGSWQAQFQLEFDSIHECYTPYNHRGLIELMLSVSPKFRGPPYLLYQKMMEILWPEVLGQPINPPSTAKAKVRSGLREALYILGVGNIAKKMYRAVYP
ncbi:MAG: hypothetical protein WD267_12605 [Balneolales bacterium]